MKPTTTRRRQIIPSSVHYVKSFRARLESRKIDGNWVMNEEESDEQLDEQVMKFIKETKAQVTFLTPPAITVIKDEPELRVEIATIGFLYIPAMEMV